MSSPVTSLRLVLVALVGAVAILAAVLLATGGDSSASRPVASSGCPAGTDPGDRARRRGARQRSRPAGRRPSRRRARAGEAKVERLMHKLKCAPAKTPEPVRDLTTISTAQAARFGQDTPGAYGTAVKQSDKLSTTPGGGASWTPVGTTPLISDDPTYRDTFGGGFCELAGRISDFTYDDAQSRLRRRRHWRRLGQDNLGESWRSIGDTLPPQPVGSSPSRRRTAARSSR